MFSRCNIKFISYFVLWAESFQRGTEKQRELFSYVGNLIDDSKQNISWLWFWTARLEPVDLMRLFSHTSVWFVFAWTLSVSVWSPVTCWRVLSHSRTYSAGRGHCSLSLSVFGVFLASAVSFVLVWFHCSLSIFCVQRSLTVLASVGRCCDSETLQYVSIWQMQMPKTSVF